MRLLLLVISIAISISVSACSGGPKCDASTCSGCCDFAGVCQIGTSDTQCGIGGASCTPCTALQRCQASACVATSGAGGGSGANAGGSAGSGTNAGGAGTNAGGAGTNAGGAGTNGGGSGTNAGGSGVTAGGSGATAGGGTGVTAGGTGATAGGGTAGSGMTAGGTGATAGGGAAGSGMTAGGSGATAGGGSPMLRTVTGSRQITFITDTGTQTATSTIANLQAQVESAGTYTQYNPTSNVMGNFSFQLPPGPYALDFTSSTNVRYMWFSSASTVDLGQVYLGRSDVGYPQGATPLTINFSNAAPWQDSDTLELTSTNAGVYDDNLLNFTGAPPMAGVTSGSLTFDYSQLQVPLVSAARGDTVVLTQRSLLGSPLPHWAAVRHATVTGLTQQSGTPSTITATFDVAAPVSTAVDVRTTQFEAFRADVHPQAVTSRTQVLLYGAPGLTAQRGVFGRTALLLYAPIAAGGTDFAGTFQYVNPYAASVPIAFDLTTLFAVTVQAPGAATAPMYGRIERFAPLTSIAGPVTPTVSPPRNVQVNGQTVTVPLSGAGQSPVITWLAPTTGTPDFYNVVVVRLVNQGGQTRQVGVASISTKALRVVIPPGTLAAGQPHMVVVAAHLNGGIDFETRPFASPGIEASADAITGPISP
ncbi:MAG: hypothetical protein JNK82_12605 [Myxococcaceae bacterium]|nr:hypothetical protein [Myxococcaceae bacterium]